VATLDDAAEALVIKLQGLDSEIEQSKHRLGEFRGQIEGASHEVDQEWTGLTEAVSLFLEKVQEEQQRLDHETQQALQAAGDAQQAVVTGSAAAHSEIGDGQAHLGALVQHATGLHASVESLVTGAGEAPAHSLAQHAAQLEQDLIHALEEAHDFVGNDVVHWIEEAAHAIRDRCQTLRTTLGEEHTHALQAAFDEWESKVDALEEYVANQGFHSSQQHAQDVVEYALTECQTIFVQQLDQLHQVVEALVSQVQELAAEAQRSGDAVVAHNGADLASGLDGTRDAVAHVLSALGSVREMLASHSFVVM
jgi:polyhydroxyalkanoate synthesis regulator phasin